MITIYHNPKCSKSREGLAFLDKNSIDYTIVKYLDKPLSSEEITSILDKLKIKPIELVRTKESIWKEKFANKTLTDEEIINAMADNPKLIERPIVINGNKAVIARPTEKIEEIL